MSSESENIAPGRIAWVDAYKAFLIALVVLGHSFQHVLTDFDGNIIVKCIYSHHMAAFFFLSGFVTWRPEFRFSVVWRKLGDLLAPFFLWWLIAFWCLGGGNLGGSFRLLIRNPDSGLWFLYVLAACHAINFSVCGLFGRLRLNADIGLLLAMGGLMVAEVVTGWNHYGFHFIAWYNIFYTIGYLARKYGSPALSVMRRKQFLWLVPLLLAAWAAMMPCWQRNADITLPLFGTLPVPLAFGYRFLAVVLAMGWEVLLLCRCDRIHPAVRLLGRNTLGIYAIHGMLLMQLAPLVKGVVGPYVGIPLLFVIVLPLSVILVTGIRRVPFVGRWLVGK